MTQVGTDEKTGAIALADVLSELYHSERSGVLTLGHEDQTRRIYLDRGMVLFCDSTVEDERLGASLVRSGKISSGKTTRHGYVWVFLRKSSSSALTAK